MTGDSSELRRLRTDWETLGTVDPLWAVYVTQEARGGKWDVSEFLATGRREVVDSWQHAAAALGHEVPDVRIALDFGCGVGRLSTALAHHAQRVVGIDISQPMLQAAHRVVPDNVLPRVDFIASDALILPIQAASVDVVYTSLVLQHMPRGIALDYVKEFMRVLAPGGLAFIQIAEEPHKSVKGRAFRVLPHWAYGQLQRRLLRYPAPMRMQALSVEQVGGTARQVGGTLLDHWPDASYGGHWDYRRLLIRRDIE